LIKSACERKDKKEKRLKVERRYDVPITLWVPTPDLEAPGHLGGWWRGRESKYVERKKRASRKVGLPATYSRGPGARRGWGPWGLCSGVVSATTDYLSRARRKIVGGLSGR
jgi:hypothetical protein